MDRRGKTSPAGIREDMGQASLGQVLGQAADVGEAPAQYDDVRINDIDDGSQRTGEALFIALQACFAALVACRCPGDSGGSGEPFPGVSEMVCREGRAGEISFDAAAATAITGRKRPITGARAWQRIVSPFPTDRVGPPDEALPDDEAAAAPRTQDDTEHHLRPGS